MADPVNTVITDLKDLEKDLEIVAVPQGPPFDTPTKAVLTPLVATASPLLKLLYGDKSIQDIGKQIDTALTDAATSLKTIAETLKTLTADSGDVGKLLTSLQNALATVQAIVPGSPPALTTGSQLLAQIGSILTDASGDGKAAADVLFKFAQQLNAIAAIFDPPATP